MFQVDVSDLIGNKFQLMIQDTNTTTDVIDTWFYWEYEMFINLLNKKNKDDKEQQEKQNKEQGEKYGNMSNFNPNKIMKQYNPSNFMNSSTSSFPRY